MHFCTEDYYNTEYDLYAEVKVENNLVTAVGGWGWWIRERDSSLKNSLVIGGE